MIKKFLMAATIVVLILLIIMAPRLIGTEKEVSSIPKVVVDYVDNRTVVYVYSAFGDYRYTNITIFAGNETTTWSDTATDDETYFLSLKIPASVVTNFYLKAIAYDGETGYEYNCTVVLDLEEEKIKVINYYDQEIFNSAPPFKKLMKEMEK